MYAIHGMKRQLIKESSVRSSSWFLCVAPVEFELNVPIFEIGMIFGGNWHDLRRFKYIYVSLSFECIPLCALIYIQWMC